MSEETKGRKTTRRDFMQAAGALGAGAYLSNVVSPTRTASAQKVETLAIDGGPKAVTAEAAGSTK